MRKFLASAWYPFVTALVLGGVTVAAFAMLKPTGEDVGNTQIVEIFGIGSWGIGPAIAVLTIITAGILNLIRRILRLRRVALLHPVVVLGAVAPWLAFSWTITDEPRYTPIARAVIDYVARPMLWGSLAACVFALILALGLLLPSKKK